MSVTIAKVQAEIAKQFGITVKELCSDIREARIAHPRALAVMVARELTGASYPRLGRAFGGRHHSTMISADKRGHDLIDAFPEYYEPVVRAREAARNEP